MLASLQLHSSPSAPEPRPVSLKGSSVLAGNSCRAPEPPSPCKARLLHWLASLNHSAMDLKSRQSTIMSM